MKLGLRARILLIAVSVTLIGMAAVLATSSYLFTNAYIASLQSRSVAIAQSLRIQLDRILQLGIKLDDLVGFDQQCRDAVVTYDGIDFAMVVGGDETILFHSDASQAGTRLADPGLLAAVRGKAQAAAEYTMNGTGGYASVVPIVAFDGEHLGSVVIGVSANLVDEKLREMMFIRAGVALLFLLGGVAVLVSTLGVFITQPLQKLIRSIDEIRSDTTDLSRRVALDSADELGALARAFNGLMQSLQATTVSKSALAAAFDALQLSEAKYRELVSNANVIILRMAQDGTVTYFNEFAERFFGYTAAEIMGKHVVGTIVPEYDSSSKRNLSEMISAIITDPQPFETNENENITRDGRRVFVRWANRVMLDEQNRPMGILAIGQDITERKRREAEVLAARNQLDATLNAIPDLLFEVDLEGRIFDYHSPQVELLAAPPEEFMGKKSSDILPPAAADVCMSALREAHETGRSYGKQYELQLPQGRLWFELSVSRKPVDPGQERRFIILARDITERVRTGEALRESDRRLSTVFHASPIGISISRLSDGRILEVNDAALQIYGYRRDEAIGHTAFDLGVYANSAQREELLQRLCEQGRIDRHPFELRRRSGEIGLLEVSGRIAELHGEKCVIVMMMDVTERKRLEEVHLRAQKLESLGTLAGGIAHDFNNILSAICGNADLAAEDVGPDHIAAESLKEIRKASARASELVRRIMAFGRPNEASHQAVDLGAVVVEVLGLLRSTLPAGISMRTEFAGQTPRILADTGQIHEVIVNLTTNAAYAIGPRAGSIEYRLEPVQMDDGLARSIPGLKAGRYVRLTVSDSGCGMDAAMLERIFDAFFTTKPVGEGTGLGLSMVHGIMKSHGGAVTVQSAPGKGSSFALYFPAVDDDPGDEGMGGSERRRPGAGMRLLYVDDEEALVFLAKRVLSRMGHGVSGFTDPREALAAFRAHPQDFDAVVTDLSMPHMSGFDLAGSVLALRPEMPVLMATGYVRAEDERLAREVGILELIHKPVVIDELGEKLDRLFRDSRDAKGKIG